MGGSNPPEPPVSTLQGTVPGASYRRPDDPIRGQEDAGVPLDVWRAPWRHNFSLASDRDDSLGSVAARATGVRRPGRTGRTRATQSSATLASARAVGARSRWSPCPALSVTGRHRPAGATCPIVTVSVTLAHVLGRSPCQRRGTARLFHHRSGCGSRNQPAGTDVAHRSRFSRACKPRPLPTVPLANGPGRRPVRAPGTCPVRHVQP